MSDDMERHRAVFIGELEGRIAELEQRVGELEETVGRGRVVDYQAMAESVSWPKSMDAWLPTGTVTYTNTRTGETRTAPAGEPIRLPATDAPKPERPTKVDGRPYCGDQSPIGFVCTLSEGHDGDHVAMNAAGSGAFFRWRRTEDAPKAEERRCGEYAPFGFGYACSKPRGHFGLHDWAEAEEREPVDVPETQGDLLGNRIRELAEGFADAPEGARYTGKMFADMLIDVLKEPKND